MRQSFLITCDETAWHVARVQERQVEFSSRSCLREETASLRSLLDDVGYSRGPVCLALPSDMTYVASIDCADLPRRQRRNMMIFRLEEQLPQDIESMTVDFLPESGGTALGVAVQTDRVRMLLDTLSQQGAEPMVIAPEALLAVWQVLRVRPGNWDMVVLADERRVEVFRVSGQIPIAWHTMANEASQVARGLKLDRACRPARSPMC